MIYSCISISFFQADLGCWYSSQHYSRSQMKVIHTVAQIQTDLIGNIVGAQVLCFRGDHSADAKQGNVHVRAEFGIKREHKGSLSRLDHG